MHGRRNQPGRNKPAHALSLAFYAAATLLFPLLSTSRPLNAQNSGADLHVEVKDPSGAPTRASGTLSGPVVRHSFRTDALGSYTFQHLAAGRYRLDVSKIGFATQSITIDLPESGTISRIVTMELAPRVAKIDVVEAAPLPGTDVPIEQIPAPVQTASAGDIDQSGSLNLSDFMNQRLSAVHINQNQENPYQPDLNYRGYTASPLLGTPEGISVYMDGVRQNQPFGDIVAWDLIPKIAISEMALIPGSNPIFGLNTLGGAISIQTKDGYSAPGGSLQISGGSFGRRAAEAE